MFWYVSSHYYYHIESRPTLKSKSLRKYMKENILRYTLQVLCNWGKHLNGENIAD